MNAGGVFMLMRLHRRRTSCVTRADMFAGHQSPSIDFTKITHQEVRFWTKHKILKRRVNISYTPEEFRIHFGGTRSRSVSAWNSTLRAGGTPLKFPDIGCRICAVATTEAAESTPIRLGVLAETGFRKRSHH